MRGDKSRQRIGPQAPCFHRRRQVNSQRPWCLQQKQTGLFSHDSIRGGACRRRVYTRQRSRKKKRKQRGRGWMVRLLSAPKCRRADEYHKKNMNLHVSSTINTGRNCCLGMSGHVCTPQIYRPGVREGRTPQGDKSVRKCCRESTSRRGEGIKSPRRNNKPPPMLVPAREHVRPIYVYYGDLSLVNLNVRPLIPSAPVAPRRAFTTEVRFCRIRT